MSDRIKKLMSEGLSRIQNRSSGAPDLPPGSARQEKSDDNDAGVSFVARDIPEWKRESLRIVLGSKMTPEDLEILEALSPLQKSLLKSLNDMDSCDVETLARLVKDKSALRAKLAFLSAWSNISKNGSVRKSVGKVGGFLRRLRAEG